MFAQIIAPILGCFLISLSLISMSSTINPSLHNFMHQNLKQIQENSPIKYLREMSFHLLKNIFSIYLLICGLVFHIYEGLKRLVLIIPLTILSIYMLQSTIISGLTLSYVPVYIFLLFSITIILFNDCAEFDALEIKSN